MQTDSDVGALFTLKGVDHSDYRRANGLVMTSVSRLLIRVQFDMYIGSRLFIVVDCRERLLSAVHCEREFISSEDVEELWRIVDDWSVDIFCSQTALTGDGETHQIFFRPNQSR